MDDWDEPASTNTNGNGNGFDDFSTEGSGFSKGRGYSIAKDNDDEWGGFDNQDFGSRNGRGGGGGFRGRGGGGDDRRGGGRGGGRGNRRGGGRSFSDNQFDDADGFNGGGDGGSDDNWGGEGFSGRGGGRGRGRGGRGGGRGGGRTGDGDFGGENDGGEGEEKKPPASTYVPEETADEDLARCGISTGINFDKYKDIPVNTSGENVPPAVKSFDEAGLRQILLDNIAAAHYKKLTPIQSYSIPIVLNGRDLMACAQTGSGKTAAFLIPIIHHLLENQADLVVEGNYVAPQCVIISPTRELTSQIYDQARKFAARSIIKCCQVYGGTQVSHQRSRLMSGCHILVATPGRLLGFVRDRLINFSHVKFIVLDEADRMLDMGFLPDVETVMQHESMPSMTERQTLMFSATFPEEIQACAGRFLHDYIFVSVGIVGGACTDIEQNFIEVDKFKKRESLLEILREQGTKGTLVFVDTKRNADFLAICLSEQNLPTTSIHGDRQQMEREQALRDFRSGAKDILVATEVAARGLDIENVRHVINYDMPKCIQQYVHRIGRTGRVGNKGKATSFYDPANDSAIAASLKHILKEANQPVPDFLDHGGFGGGYSSQNGGFGGADIRGNGLGEPTYQDAGDAEEW